MTVACRMWKRTEGGTGKNQLLNYGQGKAVNQYIQRVNHFINTAPEHDANKGSFFFFLKVILLKYCKINCSRILTNTDSGVL